MRCFTYVKGTAKTCYGPEKERHGEVSGQNDQVENKERSSFTNQAAGKIDYNAKHKYLDCCKGDVDENLGEPQGGGSVKGVGAMFVDYGPAKQTA
jgi:hypothetical protein